MCIVRVHFYNTSVDHQCCTSVQHFSLCFCFFNRNQLELHPKVNNCVYMDVGVHEFDKKKKSYIAQPCCELIS